MKILIVEDDEFSRLVVSEMIKMLYPNVEMETAEDGESALDKIEKKQKTRD